MLSRRALLTAIGAAGVLGGLAGCAGSGRTEIRFHTSKPESIPYFRDLAQAYNASQSDVTVVVDTATNLQAAFLRNSPPDVGLLNYNMEMSRFMERGALSDLGDMDEAQRIRPDVLDLVDQYAAYPGRTSVLPYSVAAASVIYNRSLFAQAGVDVPTTWDELHAVCDALEGSGVAPIYGTFSDPWTVAQGLFDYTVGGSLEVDEFYTRLAELGTEVGPDSPVSFQRDFAAPLERMMELVARCQQGAASRGYGDGNLAFGQQQAGMYLQGPWALGEIAKTDPGLDLGTFPLPMTDDPEDLRVRVNIDLALWVPEASRHQEEARDFVRFLMRQEQMDDFNSRFLGFGTTVDAAPATDPRIVEMQGYYDDARFYQGPSKAIPLTIPIDNYAQAMVLGSDVRSTLAALDADWARLALRA